MKHASFHMPNPFKESLNVNKKEIFLDVNDKDKNFLIIFAYMVDIFENFSFINTSMQGPNVHFINQRDKLTAFIKKIELWISKLQNNIFE